MILSLGERGVPWLALALAATFGGYVILRKRHRANSLESSQIDCLFLILPSLLIAGGQGVLGVPTVLDFLLLIGGGLLTALPMLWQGRALKRLPLSRAGFLPVHLADAPVHHRGFALGARGHRARVDRFRPDLGRHRDPPAFDVPSAPTRAVAEGECRPARGQTR